MIKRTLAAAAVVAFVGSTLVATPAFAAGCPGVVKQIDAYMSKTKVSGSVMSQVMKLRTEGQQLHKSGKHPASMAALRKAKKLLGM